MRNIPFYRDAALTKVAALRVAMLKMWSGARAAPPPTGGRWWARPKVRTALGVVLVAGAYYLSALIGLSIRFQSSPISPIWPPNTILLVALLLIPLETWWVYLLAVFGAHMLVEVPNGVPLATALGLYFTNSGEAVLGALLIRRYAGGPPWLSTLRQVIVYLAAAVVVAPVVTSFADAAVVVGTHWQTVGVDYWLTWRTRCVSNSLSQLTIGPALLLALTGARGWIRGATRWRWAEAALLAAGLLLAGAVVFGGSTTSLHMAPTLLYALLPFLLWAAVRFGVGGTSACLFGITLLATWTAAHGTGPFSGLSPAQNVVSLQLFLIGISVPILLLAALMQEHAATQSSLKESEARFRTLADQSPVLIWLDGPDARCTYVNAVWLAFTGRSLEQERGTGWTESIHPDEKARCLEAYMSAFAARQPFKMEFRLRRHDGAYRWLEDSGVPRYGPTGRFEGYLGSAVDITERKQAAEELRESEERYRDLVESQTEMICRYLPDSTLTFVNDAYCRYYGRPREELLGTRFLEGMDGPAREHHLQYTAALLEHGHTALDEHEVTLPDGSLGWQQWIDHAICDEAGNVVEIQAIGRDITDSRRTEDALRVSEARFRAAFESAATGMILVDTEGHALQVNRPLVEMLGYSEEELRTLTFADFTHPDDLDANLHPFRRALAGEIDSYQVEKRFIHKRGHLVWGLLSAGVVRDAAGQALYFVGQVQDITERKQAELALQESEERYRAVVRNFPRGAVLLFGEDLQHIFADGRGLADMGLSKEAIEGKTLWEAFPTDLAAALVPRYRSALAGLSVELEMGYEGRIYQAQVMPIRYSGTTAGMAFLQDITEQRRAEVLAELDRVKTAFLGNVSHEFRTPLMLLLAPAADALADREAPLPPRQRQRLELIQRGGLRLQKLVNSLLDFSRIEAGRVQAAYEPTDVASLTAELASTLRSAVERAGLRLEVACAPLTGLPRPVYVDRDMWEKIVLNLLSNALKFTLEGAITVTVRTAGMEGDWIELEVADTGTGIPAEALPHLFERFYRVPGAQARTQEGTGIGLALVHELVRLHGGTVRVTSTPGAGSTFTVAIPTGSAHLPADRVGKRTPSVDTRIRRSSTASATLFAEEALRWLPEPPQAQPTTSLSALDAPVQPARANGLGASAPRPEAASARTGATILVADDNADMRAYLARLLSERWDVQTVSDGSAALAAVSARPPDLILADVIMPGLDGFGLLAALRANPQTHALPVILLSARASEEDTVEGLQLGADDYLIKPFSARELLARVQTHLELARARGEAAARAAQLDAIFEAITDGVLVHDLERRTMRANRAYRDLLQRHLKMQGHEVDPDNVLAAPDEREHYITVTDERGHVIPQDEWPTERALRGEILTGASAVEEFTRGADGSDLQLSVTAAPVRAVDGQIKGAVAVFRDVTERRKLEQQVVEQANQLEATFNAMTDGVFVIDADGRVVRFNAAAHALFGQLPREGLTDTAESRAQAVALRDAEGRPLPFEQLPTHRVLRGEVLAGENALTLMVRTHDGRERTVSLTGSPLRDATGRISGGVSVVRDETELKRTQTALAEQERLFRTLVENSPDIITRFDRNLCHLYVSPASEAVTGIPAQARWGKTYAQIGLPEDVYGPWEQSLREVFATGQTRVFETNYQVPGRPPRVSQVRYIPEFGAGGSVESVLGVTSDITELKQTEAALRQSEERFSKAFHASPTAMAILSLSTRRLLDVNAAEVVLTGYSRDELLGATIGELGLIAPTDLDTLRELWRQEKRVYELPLYIRTKSGEIRSCLGSTETIWLGSEPCLIVTTRDVTERERAAEELRVAKAAAEAAQREEEQRRHEAERREQIAESLREVLAILNTDRQLTKTLDFITRQAGRLLSSDAAAIFTTDADGAHGATKEAQTMPGAGAASGGLALQATFALSPLRLSTRGKHRLTVGDAAVRKAMVARRAVAVYTPAAADQEPIPSAHERGGALEPVERVDQGEQAGGYTEVSSDYLVVHEEPLPAPYRALLAIPIVAQGQIYGGLLLLYTTPRRFSADEVALAMAYGDQIALAIANARLQDHIEREATEAERNRLARELHDTVTQEIFTASVLTESIPQVWELHRAEAEAQLRQLHQLTRGALAALRALLLELRPAVLEQKALAELLRQLGEAMTTRSGVPVTVAIADDCPPIPVPVKLAFYRIAQEALMNAAKYASAHTITVQLRYLQARKAIQLEVHDDGLGFDTGAIPAGHFGLGMMRERARAAGASLRITSRPEQGTRVAAMWTENGRASFANQEYAVAGRARRGGAR